MSGCSGAACCCATVSGCKLTKTATCSPHAMVACGDADAMVTGLTRTIRWWPMTTSDWCSIRKPGHRIVFGLAMVRSRDKTVFVADTNVNENPSPQALARLAIQAASHVRRMGLRARASRCSAFSNFGNPWRESANLVREAIGDPRMPRASTFEYDGEMAPDMALNPELRNRFSTRSAGSQAPQTY